MSASEVRKIVNRLRKVVVSQRRERYELGLRRVISTELSPIVRYFRATKPPSALSDVKWVPQRDARASRM